MGHRMGKHVITLRLRLLSLLPAAWRARLQIWAFCRLHFLEAPPLRLDAQKLQAFEERYQTLLAGAPGSVLDYRLPYPKHEFLRYLVARKHVLIHGSNQPDIVAIAPNWEKDLSGRPVRGVFAASDGIWPLFFAVIDHARCHDPRDRCFTVRAGRGLTRRFYYFSIDAPVLRDHPWTEGMIYILPNAAFERGGVQAEWVNREPVVPLARLPVGPADFPFRDQIQGHARHEPIWLSYLRWAVWNRAGTRRRAATNCFARG
jgi:hypothetical protein